MFILSNFLITIARILEIIGSAIPWLNWIIVIRALLSWVNPDPFNPIVQFFHRVTEPLLEPFRRLVPIHKIGIDVSPLLAILALWILQAVIYNFFVATLLQMAAKLA